MIKRNDWNDYVIRCEGRHIQLWLNGLKTVDYTEPDEKFEQKGLLGLQIHAGPASEAVGVDGSYFVQGVMYAVSTVWTLQMRDPRVRQSPTMGRDTPRESIASSTLAGGRYVWHNRAIRTVMMLVLIPSLLGQPYTSLLPVFARDVLDIGPTGQGVLLGAVGIGASEG